MDELELIKRKLAREIAARKKAEEILEERSLKLFELNQSLKEINASHQKLIYKRTIEIQEKEKNYRNFIENSNDIIYSTDEKGLITYANPQGLKLSGYGSDELIGNNYSKLVSERYFKKIKSFYRTQFIKKIPSTYIEFPMITKLGEELWIAQTADMSIVDGKSRFNFVARDISGRKKAEKALLLSEDKYRSIIENMELGLLEIDRDGKILKAYPKFTKLTGYKSSELEGKLAAETLLSPEDVAKMNQRNSDRRHGEPGVYETRIIKKDGTDVWVLISGAPYYDEKNRMIGSVGIHLDISHQKRLEEELIQAKEIAEHSLESKDLFLANMSHEIRTPLNGVMGLTEVLLQSNLNGEQRNYLETVMVSSKNLLFLINGILDLSKLSAGNLELNIQPVELISELIHIKNAFSLAAEKKGIAFDIKWHNMLESEWYQLDAVRLNETLTNLIGNAIKFTDEGKVSLTVKKQLVEDGFAYFSFEVEDTGVGIPDEDVERIFNRFEQASNNDSLIYGGTGLGLAISKKIVELMGGKLNVISSPGKGSKFFFETKFPMTEKVEKPDNFVDASNYAFEGVRILVAEDVEINQLLIKKILGDWKCDVMIVENGQEVLDVLLKKEVFDLILMDVRMPVMNGLDATRFIRENPAYGDMPIIALTANAIKEEINKCLNAGMNGYLSKPYSQEQLFSKIAEFIRPSVSVQKQSFIDLDGLKAVTNGDLEFEERMINLFVEDSTTRIGQLEECISNMDDERIMSIVHAMKPAVSYICVDSLLEQVKEIEQGDLSSEKRMELTSSFLLQLRLVLDELINR